MNNKGLFSSQFWRFKIKKLHLVKISLLMGTLQYLKVVQDIT